MEQWRAMSRWRKADSSPIADLLHGRDSSTAHRFASCSKRNASAHALQSAAAVLAEVLRIANGLVILAPCRFLRRVNTETNYAATTSRPTFFLRFFVACHRSYWLCIPAHRSELVPSASDKRIAISAEIEALPFKQAQHLFPQMRTSNASSHLHRPTKALPSPLSMGAIANRVHSYRSHFWHYPKRTVAFVISEHASVEFRPWNPS